MMTATTDSAALAASSTVDTTGAPKPSVNVLITGRAVALTPCTPKAMRTPATMGTHCPEWKKPAGSETVTVCDDEPAPKARPPAVGRTTVCTTSLALSSTGILSATISTASRTARISKAQPLLSQFHDGGRVIRLV